MAVPFRASMRYAHIRTGCALLASLTARTVMPAIQRMASFLDATFRQHFTVGSCDRRRFFAGVWVGPDAMASLFLTAIGYPDRLCTDRQSDGQNHDASNSVNGAIPRCNVSPAFHGRQLRPAALFCWHLRIFRFSTFIFITNKKMENRLTKIIIDVHFVLFAKFVVRWGI